ncbi:MAG: hypothetical protein EPN26_07810 [Rhodospirillales bacterium]|nr:MAG: hypothetical protein EPN26_07810 [Rhodospirillales bacterium]
MIGVFRVTTCHHLREQVVTLKSAETQACHYRHHCHHLGEEFMGGGKIYASKVAGSGASLNI